MQIHEKQMLGLSDTGLVDFVSANRTHRLRAPVIKDWQRLEHAAKLAGFTPIVASSYRDFGRQAAIWSGKACGDRTVLDDNNECVDLSCLSDLQKIEAIMRFSALPGASRHHWGTDFDIAELSCLPSDYQIELTVSETRTVLAPFYDWLEDYLASDNSFYRPYCRDTGGVSIEPWHLSHRQEATLIEANMSKHQLCRFYQSLADQRCPEAFESLNRAGYSELALVNTVVENFDKLYHQFICLD